MLQIIDRKITVRKLQTNIPITPPIMAGPKRTSGSKSLYLFINFNNSYFQINSADYTAVKEKNAVSKDFFEPKSSRDEVFCSVGFSRAY